jgi:hypothetical protein
MKISYTCIIGKYDKLHQPLIVSPNWKYICFSDNKELLSKVKIGVYDILPISNPHNLDPVRLARLYKILALGINDSDILVWNDANYAINCELDTLVRKYLIDDIDLVLAKHPKRNCLYDEGTRCIELKKDNKETIDSQLNQYCFEKLPYDRGLYETGIMIRRGFSKQDSLFYYEWFKQIRKYSRRDQISLPYCLWKYSDFAPRIKAINSKELRSNFIKIRHLANEFGGKSE